MKTSPRSTRQYTMLVTLAFVVLGLIFATFYGFAKGDLWGKKFPFFQYILVLDIIIFSLSALFLIQQLRIIYLQRKQNLAGSRLHSRIVKWLSWIAVFPPIIIAAFSWLFFNQSIHSWFNQKVQTTLEQSTSVAEAYLEEHKKVLAVSAEAMALDIAANWAHLRLNPDDLEDFVNAQAQLRSLNEAILFDTLSRVWARSHLTLSLDLFEVLTEDLRKAQEAPVVYNQNDSDRVRVLVQVIPNENIYLLIGRYIDPKILKRIQETTDARSDYFNFQKNLDQSKITFAMIFGLITLLILVLSAWAGLWFSEQIAGPIGKVIAGAEQVSHGQLNLQVDVQTTEPDIKLLANTFNRMLTNLLGKQKELLDANKQIEDRRQFIHSVLENVSTGVISLNNKFHIALANSRALEILQKTESDTINHEITSVLPELSFLTEAIRTRRFSQGQVEYQSPLGRRHLLARIMRVDERNLNNFTVLTFDDVTDLMHAQKQAAWSDVARRIAHEIKNPLTPIQLSTERLRKRYTEQITNDVDSFQRCLDTISRQVDHIGHLVGEFAAYAKMPQPTMRPINLKDLVLQTIGFYQDAYPSLIFDFSSDSQIEKNISHYSCDAEQIGQVLANLIKNSIDAVQESGTKDGKIMLRIVGHPHTIEIRIEDNGNGFPTNNPEELLDPYVTYKEKGTGLGLAIVKKIVLDHEGTIVLQKSKTLGGASISMQFPQFIENNTKSKIK